MKKLFRRNQVIVTLLAVMIAIAGYLNYADNNAKDKLNNLVKEVAGEEGEKVNEKSNEILGKDDLLNSDRDIESPDNEEKKTDDKTAGDKTNKETKAKDEKEAGNNEKKTKKNAEANNDVAKNEGESENPGEAVFVNGVSSSNFAATAKLNREQTRAKTKATLQEIIDSKNIADDAKKDAIQKMVELTDIASKETAAENLLAAKGFENSVVTITGEKADVAVGMKKVSDAQRAQIEDVVKRKTDIPVASIYITPVSE